MPRPSVRLFVRLSVCLFVYAGIESNPYDNAVAIVRQPVSCISVPQGPTEHCLIATASNETVVGWVTNGEKAQIFHQQQVRFVELGV